MSSTLRDIADAVRDALAEVTFSSVQTQPDVVRANWPDYSIEDLASPVLVVMPGSLTITRASRLQHQYDCDISIWVARHTPTDTMADAMMDLAEEVIDVLRAHTWGEDISFPGGATSPTSIEIDVNPDEALQERNVWRAVITSRYTLFRSASS